MKNLVLILVLAIMGFSGLFAQHFIPQWWIDPPPDGQNPYTAHNVLISGAKINGVDLEAGDEIGIFDCTMGDFDTSLLVGAVTITADDLPLSIDEPIGVICSTEGGEVPGSAQIGDMVILKFWDASAGVEYSYPEMSVQFNEPPSWPEDPYSGYLFEGGGTTYVVTAEYWPPVASDTETLTPPAGPFGGYVYDVVFDGTGITLEEGAIIAGGGGTMTIHAFDENSTDTYFDPTNPINDGTVPVADFTDYGWYIDWDGTFSAGETYPIVFSIDLNDVLPEGYVMDAETVGIYRRDIHGTSYFYEVESSYDPVANVITFYLHDATDLPGEFILSGLMEENPLPVELSSFTALMSNTNSAVNLTWITQSEENMIGYRIMRGNSDALAQAEDQNTLIAATNTSQTVTYIFSDAEIEPEQTYYYWLEALDLDGTNIFYGPIAITTPGQGAFTPVIPLVTGISSLYPNPFNPELTISYTVNSKLPVRIDIVNVRGQIIRTLVNENKETGVYRLNWNGTDADGRHCSSGIYFVRMQAGSEEFFAKAILMK